jgi:hypothetical protein
MDKVIVTRAVLGVCYMQVCAEESATDEEILTICNAENPSGTILGWTTVIRTGEKKNLPVACDKHHTRKHFLVSC